MRIDPMTMTHFPSPRFTARATQAALPLYLVGLAGPECPARGQAVAALQALGFEVASFATELQLQVAEAWRLDLRDVVPHDEWELVQPVLAASRCGDPFFRAWCARQGIDLERPRSPRWATMHWSQFRRQADPLAFVRAAEAWLIEQHLKLRTHLVLTDVHTLQEYQLLQHWHGRTIELSMRRMPGPLGPHDAWISATESTHLGERVAVAISDLFGAQALGAGSMQ